MPLSSPMPSSVLTRSYLHASPGRHLLSSIRCRPGEHGATLCPSTPTRYPVMKRRFRLPSMLTANSRTSGLTPSVAEDIDFETQLASYSDDDLNNLNITNMRRKQSKHERRRSKDDAFVHILVAGHSRRTSTRTPISSVVPRRRRAAVIWKWPARK